MQKARIDTVISNEDYKAWNSNLIYSDTNQGQYLYNTGTTTSTTQIIGEEKQEKAEECFRYVLVLVTSDAYLEFKNKIENKEINTPSTTVESTSVDAQDNNLAR